MIRIDYIFQLSVLLLSLASSNGLVRFANYYQDHMVLQRAPQKAIVWGYTNATNAPITLTLNNKIYRASTSSPLLNSLGDTTWSVTLDAQPAGGPFQVKVTQPLPNGTLETITLNDVLFGDVWVCSGQSNMGFSLGGILNASIEIQNANNFPKIRLFSVSQRESAIPTEELLAISLQWSVASNITAASGANSAVCWLFGRMIHQGIDEVPIGLVHTSWGGTAIELWSPPDALKSCNITETEQISYAEEPLAESDNGLTINNTGLYNSMIYPLTKMVIKGAIWYQGESNAGIAFRYNCSLVNLIESWRNVWHTRTNGIVDSLFPFGVVQISTWVNDTSAIGGFPWIRWHETFDVGYVPNNVVPNVFGAVTLDLRDDVGGLHPRTKLDVGYRLSRSGLAVAYGLKNIPFQGPIISDISVASDSSKVNVSYSAAISKTIELRNPNGFEVCCAGSPTCKANEQIWVATPASVIEGSALTIALTVPSSCVSKPINAIRYLWRTTPCVFKEAAVYSTEDSNLPAPAYIRYF